MSMGVSPPPFHGGFSGQSWHHDPSLGGSVGLGQGAHLPGKDPGKGGSESFPLPLITRSLRRGPAGLAGLWGGEAAPAGTSPLSGDGGDRCAPGRGAEGR